MSLFDHQLESTYNQLIANIETWSRLGVETLPAGTRRIAHIPHLAPHAYLHTIFPPLPAGEIGAMEVLVGKAFPPSLVFFFSRTNGMHLFHQISVYGLRTTYDRTNIPAMLEQPFDIGLPNEAAAANEALRTCIVAGSLIEEETDICVGESGEAFFWDKKAEKLLPLRFDNIIECLLWLFSTASLFFDDRGRKTAPQGMRFLHAEKVS